MGQIHLRVVCNFCKQNNITAAHFLFAKRFHSPKTDRKFRSPDVVLGDLRGFTGFIDFLEQPQIFPVVLFGGIYARAQLEY